MLQEFILSFWCMPPAEETNRQRYEEIAECGFNLVLTWFHDIPMNRRVLDLCRDTGLKALIADFRLMTPPDTSAFAPYVEELINDFRDHPGLAGYYLRDEPHLGLFPFLGAVHQFLREHDPKRLPYINLFPLHAGEKLLGTPTYAEHVQKFIDIVKPAIVAWDHYALLKDGIGKEYFENLEVIRRLSLKARLPCMQTILVTPHGKYLDPGEPELRWQVYSSLAYGVRGIAYFTYWTPEPWHRGTRGGIIGADGKRTPHYAMVKRINGEIRALGPTLMKLTSRGVYHTAPVPEDARRLDRVSPVKALTGGELLLGWLQDDTGTDYLLVMNRSLQGPTTAVCELRKPIADIARISKRTGRPEKRGFRNVGNRLEITLGPGDGELLRLGR
jgi:hypothetical protein